jgi:hypothetical protein
MLPDLITDGQCFLRRSGDAVKDDASHDSRQTTYHEPFPNVSHMTLLSIVASALLLASLSASSNL